VDVEITWGLLIAGFEKGQPLLMAVARRQTGDQLALEIIERGKQGQCAMSRVIVGLGANVANAERQTRLRALQRLALRFLVAAQYQRLVRRVEIQPITSQNSSSKRLSFDSCLLAVRLTIRHTSATSSVPAIQPSTGPGRGVGSLKMPRPWIVETWA
jgi:hypothetical protein